MIEWYKDKELSIFFDNKPSVGMRYARPSMSEAEKKAVSQYPFEKKHALKVTLFDHLKTKNMSLLFLKTTAGMEQRYRGFSGG